MYYVDVKIHIWFNLGLISHYTLLKMIQSKAVNKFSNT